MRVENRYEQGTDQWDLMEAAEKLASQTASGDSVADAMDRRTVAFYRIGAALVDAIHGHGNDQAIAEEIEGLHRSMSYVADAISKIPKAHIR